MNKTGIEYLTHTWNPLAMKCDRVSPGCANCWHLATLARLVDNENIKPEKISAYNGNGPFLDPDVLKEPRARKKPAVIGAQFMGDLFHDQIHIKYLDPIFLEMRQSRQHQFIILTKRPCRMLGFFRVMGRNYLPENVWIGVSVENQETAETRIPVLNQIKTPRKILSIEPMLGPIALEDLERDIAWMIVGGESGAGARPMQREWVRGIQDYCAQEMIPFYFKQWGSHASNKDLPETPLDNCKQCPEGIREILWEGSEKCQA
jgi:protein gp37